MPAAPSTAAEALRLAVVDPARAWELARHAEQAASAEQDWATVSLARRAGGVAAMQLRDLGAAVSALNGSIEAGRRARSATLVAEARMSLASALVLRGSPAGAFEAIERALNDLHGLAAARARTQRSAILQELGRIDEALRDLRHALPILRRAGDATWEARALSNRSLMLTARRSFGAAEADLVRARQLCAEHGLVLAGAYAEQNLGCLYAGRGDIPAALERFDAAEALYRSLGMQVSSLLIDRAQLLLSVRLLDEARAAAEAAVATCKRQRRWVQLPEAKLLVSTAALLQNDVAAAMAAATQAERSFARLGRTQWLALARYAHLQALVAADLSDVSPARARRCADELAQAGWVIPALEARVLAGYLALQRGQPVQAHRDLALASRARANGPADARSHAWLAEALLRKADGRRRGARAALTTGLRVLEEHRATLGATELRAHISMHRDALARVGLRMAMEDRDPAQVHWWAERRRATAALLHPVRPPDDQSLAHTLEDLRATMTEIGQARSNGEPTGALVQRQVTLERAIRDHSRRSPGASGVPLARPPALRELCADLGDAALVEYVELDDLLHAVTLVDGQVHLHTLGDTTEVRHALAHVPFALRRLATRSTRPAQVAAATAVLTHAGNTFDATLLRPMADRLGDRPLVVIPTGWLQSLPWSILPSCAGRPVTVAPSATLWHRARHRAPPPAGGVLVVAGPGLPAALQEAHAVAAMYPGSTLLVGNEATAAAVGPAMDGALLAHVAAHGMVRSDNPQFSCLTLADGPFTVYDIERLTRTPDQVVLAACDTARSRVLAGDEILGLAAALLAQETATLVAPVVPVPDAETAPLMTAYHRLLRAGHPPAQALATAQQQRRGDGPGATASAAGFICLGSGLDQGTG